MKNLPDILITYFHAVNAQDFEALISCFTTDAKVKDEGQQYIGHEQIHDWNRKAADKYKCTHLIKKWTKNNNAIDTIVEVSGLFPGSPVNLTFHFILVDGKISELKIK